MSKYYSSFASVDLNNVIESNNFISMDNAWYMKDKDKIIINLLDLSNDIISDASILVLDDENTEVFITDSNTLDKIQYNKKFDDKFQIIFNSEFIMDKLIEKLVNVRNIKFEIYLDNVIIPTLPPNLEKLTLVQNDNRKWPIIKTEYPNTLKKCFIDIHESYYKKQEKYTLPDNLPSNCSIILNMNVINLTEEFFTCPNNITEMTLSIFRFNIKPIWPLMLRKLDITIKAEDTTYLDILPHGLESFTLYVIKYNHQLILPSTVTQFEFKGELQYPETLNNLPDSITDLKIELKNKTKFILNKLPANCIKFDSNIKARYVQTKYISNLLEVL